MPFNLPVKIWYIVPILLLVSIAAVIIFSQKENKSLSPLSDSPALVGFTRPLFKSSAGMDVIGFLPYWNVKPETNIDFSVITQLVYFGLLVDEDGNFVKFKDGGVEQGFYKLGSPVLLEYLNQARQNNRKTLIGIVSFDSDEMDNLLSSQNAKNILIDNIITEIKDNNFDGVNMDFEYFEEDSLTFGPNYTSFLRQLRGEMDKQNRKWILSADIYPKAVIKNKPYQVKELGQIVDQVFLMAYDFTQQNTEISGPVAPLRTDRPKEMSVVQGLSASLAIMDKKKIILGIPLYGYEWETVDSQHFSPVVGDQWGAIASYDRVTDLELTGVKVNWDDMAYSPWIVYEDEGVTKQIYYENSRSIVAKVGLAGQLNLGGIGFWALGYEGNKASLWREIKKSL